MCEYFALLLLFTQILKQLRICVMLLQATDVHVSRMEEEQKVHASSGLLLSTNCRSCSHGLWTYLKQVLCVRGVVVHDSHVCTHVQNDQTLSILQTEHRECAVDAKRPVQSLKP